MDQKIYESLDKQRLIAAPTDFSELISSPEFFNDFNTLTNSITSNTGLPVVTIIGTKGADGIMRDAQGNPSFMSDLDVTARIDLESTLSSKNFADATSAFDTFHDNTRVMKPWFSEDELTPMDFSSASRYLLPAQVTHGLSFIRENFDRFDLMDGSADHTITKSGLASAANLEQQEISEKFSKLLEINQKRRLGNGSPIEPEALTTFEFEHIDEIINAGKRIQ